MKKVISVILVFVLTFSLLCPAFTVDAAPDNVSNRSTYPVIYLSGNSAPIVDENEVQVYDFSPDSDTIVQMAKNILFPHFFHGLLTGDFEEYYDVFEEEIAKLYDKCSLDENGQPKYGTGIRQYDKNMNKKLMNKNCQVNGTYGLTDYWFRADWRLDPLKNAELLEEFINGIRAATKKNKVCLVADCLGSVMILAYLGKYGPEKLHAIGFGAPVGFGSELINDTFSGNMTLDVDAIERFCNDDFLAKVIPAGYGTVLTLIRQTVELAKETGVLKTATKAFMDKLYNRLYKELVPRVSISSYATWPSYWGLVTATDYASTRDFTFGQPGSERYEKYKGLIEQLDNYDSVVRQRIPDLIQNAMDNGVNVSIVCKYGFQAIPIIKSSDLQTDIWVSLKLSSLGATTAKVGETLSDEYIADRTRAGFAKYISPDKIIDASTCRFPDVTWFIKNAIHDDPCHQDSEIMMSVCAAEKQLTVNDIPQYPQFIVFDRENELSAPMTEENCHTETWYKEDTTEPGFFGKIGNFFDLLKQWFNTLLTVVKQLTQTEAEPETKPETQPA